MSASWLIKLQRPADGLHSRFRAAPAGASTNAIDRASHLPPEFEVLAKGAMRRGDRAVPPDRNSICAQGRNRTADTGIFSLRAGCFCLMWPYRAICNFVDKTADLRAQRMGSGSINWQHSATW